jgi:hypothetical protein
MLLVVAAPALAAETHLLIVAGLGGDPRQRDAFHAQALALASAAETRLGLRHENVACLTESPERDPSAIDGRSDARQRRRRAREAEGARTAGRQRLRVPDRARQLRRRRGPLQSSGPDLTPARLSEWLAPLREQQLVVVSTASASGCFAEALAAPGRIVVTATKSGQERNQTVFGEHFVAALTGQGADVDKNGRVSVLEAFEYATREVARFYESEKRLQTEHARLEDAGGLAQSTFLQGDSRAADAEEKETDDPALAPLYAARRELERQIEALRSRKQELAPERYTEQLEGLLVKLAQQNESIDAARKAK